MRAVLTQALLSAFAAQCGTVTPDGVLNPGENSGAVSIAVTDAPVDSATRVVVEFAGVELDPVSGSTIRIDLDDLPVDVLSLRGGASTPLLQNNEIEAGRYEGIRLLVNAAPDVQDDSFVELEDGRRFPLVIASGADRGLRIDRPFTVTAGGRIDLTVDFDLRKSVIDPVGTSANFVFRPTVRMVDNAAAGAIAGTISDNLVNPTCTPFIYAFAGTDVVPDDMDADADADPLVSVPAALDTASARFRYRISFLEAADYTLALTCDGARDRPEAQDTLRFAGTRTVTVVAGQTATADF